MNSDVQFNIKTRLSGCIKKAIKNNFKSGRTIDLLGCSIVRFKKYFEGKFKQGMDWNKFTKGEIHVDHILPCAIFDLSNPEAQKICFHYTNLQPLWPKDNMSKGKKIFNTKRLINILCKNKGILK